MRCFRKHETRLPISMLCILLLCMSIGGTALVPAPALGQVGIVEVAAVVDFQNLSKMPGPMFAKMATDAVVVELVRSGKFSATARDALDAKMKELGYQAPLTPSLMQRLGQELGASCVVSGELILMKVDGEKKEAEARIVVKMLDVSSGELVNGAVATGRSHPRIGYGGDEDKLLVEAINDAARNAVDMMVQYIIPQATVLSMVGTSEILVNKGAQEGLEPGMEMIVLRRSETGQDEVVGRIKVSRVTDTDAMAKVIRAPKGIRPEDRVRAIYELPSIKEVAATETARASTVKKRTMRGTKLLWGLVALLGLAALLKAGEDEPETLPSVTAQAGAVPDIHAEFFDTGILITWNNPRNIGDMNLREYHIWRNQRGQISYPAGDESTVAPIAWPAPWVAPRFGGYDHSFVDTEAGREIDGWVCPTEDHTELEEGDMLFMPGLQPGKPNRYWVSCVYRRISPTATGEEAITYWETMLAPTGIATALHRPTAESATTEAGDLSVVTFTWLSSGGADQYAIEVSPDPAFPREKTWVHHLTLRTPADETPCSKTFTNVLSNAAELTGSSLLYWRVGARNSVDSPGPVPAGPSPQATGAKNTRFIYSHYETFEVGQPPFPGGEPGDGTDGGDTPPPPPGL